MRTLQVHLSATSCCRVLIFPTTPIQLWRFSCCSTFSSDWNEYQKFMGPLASVMTTTTHYIILYSTHYIPSWIDNVLEHSNPCLCIHKEKLSLQKSCHKSHNKTIRYFAKMNASAFRKTSKVQALYKQWDVIFYWSIQKFVFSSLV